MSDNFDLSFTKEVKLLELAAEEGLKISFEISTSLASFWIKMKKEYIEVSEIALKTLLTFCFTLPL